LGIVCKALLWGCERETPTLLSTVEVLISNYIQGDNESLAELRSQIIYGEFHWGKFHPWSMNLNGICNRIAALLHISIIKCDRFSSFCNWCTSSETRLNQTIEVASTTSNPKKEVTGTTDSQDAMSTRLVVATSVVRENWPDSNWSA